MVYLWRCVVRPMMDAQNAAATNDSYYLAHQKIYPRDVSGRFARLRTIAAWVLLGLFYVGPWVPWAGRQAVLFDLPARKFYIFGLVLWPQDFIFLTGLLIILALTLFLSTAIAGRLWCGYACPQTVWTEVFLWMERKTEGSRNERMKLDKGPWTSRKFARKGAKQFLWITFSAWTGFTFVGYFTPVQVLAHEIATLSLGPWETFWTIFYGIATYGNAGYLREQVPQGPRDQVTTIRVAKTDPDFRAECGPCVEVEVTTAEGRIQREIYREGDGLISLEPVSGWPLTD